MATVSESFELYPKKITPEGEIISAEINYIVFEAKNENEALFAVLGVAAEIHGSAQLSGIELVSKENENTFKVKAVYDDPLDDDLSVMSFDCGGGTKHLTHSIKQTIAFGTKAAGGAINWNGKSGAEMQIAGLDVPTAQLRETYTRVMKVSKLTTSFKRKVANLVGKVNSGTFKGWNPGEVMFLGISYSAPNKKRARVQVTFHFAIQLNETARVADKTVSKKGFEYAWALSKTVEENGVPKTETEAVYVDQVCESDSFSALGL